MPALVESKVPAIPPIIEFLSLMKIGRIARSIVRALSRESRLSIGLISQRFFEGIRYIRRMDVLDGWISSNFAEDN